MFTGIIETMGQIKKIENNKFFIKSPFQNELSLGQSIAHDGVCLTVSNLKSNYYEVELMPETFKRSHFKNKKPGDYLNLERSMLISSRFDGHMVQGHCDFMGEITQIKKDHNSYLINIKIPNNYAKFLVEKGSVAVNGISLTVIASTKNYFSIGIIPHTWQVTNLQYLQKNDLVNIETDILAKYFVKLMQK